MYATQVISKMTKDRFHRDMVNELRSAGVVNDRLGRPLSSLSYEDVRYLVVLERAKNQ